MWSAPDANSTSRAKRLIERTASLFVTGVAVQPARICQVDPMSPEDAREPLFNSHNGPKYRTPTDLQRTPDGACRYLVVGGCLAQPFPEIGARINPSMQGDFLLLNNLDVLPPISAETVSRL